MDVQDKKKIYQLNKKHIYFFSILVYCIGL